MLKNNISSILTSKFPKEIVDNLLFSYKKGLEEYHKQNWKYFGVEIAQFVECARRLLEYKVFGQFTPISNKLSVFNNNELVKLENTTNNTKSEEYRIIIPRILYSMYCVRNKRGSVHKNHIDPNKMDSDFLINSSKWILAEIIRLSSNKNFKETIKIVEEIMIKEICILWDNGICKRILDTKMSCRNKILILLYFENNQFDFKLHQSIEYSNLTMFKNTLKSLHKKRLLEYSDHKCFISPTGITLVENLINNITK